MRCRATGEDIAWDIAPHAAAVIMSAKTWMKEEFASVTGPFGEKNNMYRRPWISSMHADGSVEFEDGSSVQDIDIVMFCTGAPPPPQTPVHWPQCNWEVVERSKLAAWQSAHLCREGGKCAGYHYSMPFLTGDVVDTERSHVRPLYQHLLHPGFGAGLSFIGLPFKVVPFPQFEVQTRLVARLLSGNAKLPPESEMQEWIQAHYRCAWLSADWP